MCSQDCAPSADFEESTLQYLLQTCDLVTHCRLAAVECFRSARVPAEVYHGSECNPLIGSGLGRATAHASNFSNVMTGFHGFILLILERSIALTLIWRQKQCWILERAKKGARRTTVGSSRVTRSRSGTTTTPTTP